MSLLHVSGLAYRHPGSPDPLFEDASFDIGPGEQIGLIGSNGTGKTTLLRLLAGDLAPTAGEIVRRRGLVIAHARQEVAARPDLTLHAFVFSADERLENALAELRMAEVAAGDERGALRYAEQLVRYEELDGYAFETEVDSVLEGLGFGARDRELPLVALSHGQRNRAQLARLLLRRADLVLLDEPTNHLDRVACEWLEAFLERTEAALLIVAHDRRLLDRVTHRTLELRRGALFCYAGGYEAAKAARQLCEAQALEAYEAQARRARAAERAAAERMRLAAKVARKPPGARHGNDFYNAKAARVQRTARILRERPLAEAPAERPWSEPPMTPLTFPAVRPAGGDAVVCTGVTKAFGARPVLDGIDLRVPGTGRLAIIGPNGSGKSTLLRILAGRDSCDAGAVQLAPRVRIGYFAQEADDLDPDETPVEVCVAAGGDERWVRTLLACLRLRGRDANRPVGTLSSGERARVVIARLLVAGANLLLLDEPTNHLDLEAREALESTLAQYPGAIVLVSHDREFVDRLADADLQLGAPA